jgi:hypothetical protein
MGTPAQLRHPPASPVVPHKADDRPPLPLGTIVLAHGPTESHAATLLAFACKKWPWVVPCLSWREPDEWSPVLVPTIRALLPHKKRIVFLRPHETLAGPKRLVTCVSQRRDPPTPAVLAAYVGLRCQDVELAEPVRQQFEFALTHDPSRIPKSRAAYSRAFAHFGPLTARDWRAIAILAWEVNQAGRPGRHYVSAPTRERYAHHYLRDTWYNARRLAGWEWVIERALRVARYVLV